MKLIPPLTPHEQMLAAITEAVAASSVIKGHSPERFFEVLQTAGYTVVKLPRAQETPGRNG